MSTRTEPPLRPPGQTLALATPKGELIQLIEEVIDEREDRAWGGWDGYRIVTDRQTIKVMIDNGQSCCESWGYLHSEDDLDKYVGAILTDIEVTDTQNQGARVKRDCTGMYDGGAMFVDFKTSRGTFQLVVYNEHNGYYGHSVRLISDQVTKEDTL